MTTDAATTTAIDRPSQQCEAITPSGVRCGIMARTGTLCHVHHAKRHGGRKRMHATTIYVREEQFMAARAIADAAGVSTAFVIRRALDMLIETVDATLTVEADGEIRGGLALESI